jgi:hypothetical protein
MKLDLTVLGKIANADAKLKQIQEAEPQKHQVSFKAARDSADKALELKLAKEKTNNEVKALQRKVMFASFQLVDKSLVTYEGENFAKNVGKPVWLVDGSQDYFLLAPGNYLAADGTAFEIDENSLLKTVNKSGQVIAANPNPDNKQGQFSAKKPETLDERFAAARENNITFKAATSNIGAVDPTWEALKAKLKGNGKYFGQGITPSKSNLSPVELAAQAKAKPVVNECTDEIRKATENFCLPDAERVILFNKMKLEKSTKEVKAKKEIVAKKLVTKPIYLTRTESLLDQCLRERGWIIE